MHLARAERRLNVLLKIPSITADERDIMKDIKLNIVSKSQFRLKCTILPNDIEKHLDIAITEVKCKITTSGLAIILVGIDMLDKYPCRLSLNVNVFKKKVDANGNLGPKKIDAVLTSISDVKTMLTQLI